MARKQSRANSLLSITVAERTLLNQGAQPGKKPFSYIGPTVFEYQLHNNGMEAIHLAKLNCDGSPRRTYVNKYSTCIWTVVEKCERIVFAQYCSVAVFFPEKSSWYRIELAACHGVKYFQRTKEWTSRYKRTQFAYK